MAHLFYFYYPADELDKDEVEIGGEEAHHAVKVVRIKIGEKIGVINGKGKKWICEVIECTPKTLRAKLLKTIDENNNQNKFTLIFPWLNKDDPIEILVSMGTEMGIDEFRFFQADRSIRPIKFNSKIEKWIIQSCKVTGRSLFPTIKFYKNLESALEDIQGTLFVATASRNSKPLTLMQVPTHCGLIIGPEGDLTEREINVSIEAGAIMVHLGPRTLKSETAGILGSAIILMKQGNYDKFNREYMIVE